MQLNSSGAWNEAVAAVNTKREMLFAIAGVFFLLPGLVSVLLFADVQEQLMTVMRNQAQARKFFQSGALTPVVIYSLFAFVLQTIGNLALLTILTDRSRPTVGEALKQAIGLLPTGIGATALMILGVFIASLIFSLLSALLGAVVKPLLLGVLIGLVAIAVTRLSLAMPTIAAENQRNPITALQRSWNLTDGNTGRMLLFYVVLGIVYMVILLLVGGIAGVLATLIAGEGTGALLISGLVSGAIGAIASVLFAAVQAAVHRQLAGPSSASLGATFE